MLNTAVSIGNIAVGRMLAGMLTLSLDHPFVLCCVVSGLAGSACAVLLDVLGPRAGAAQDPVRAERATRTPHR